VWRVERSERVGLFFVPLCYFLVVVLGCPEIGFWQDTEGLGYNVPSWVTVQRLLQRTGL